MPAIQVSKTDTFESQRQKINQIGSQVFSITQGGSDLATGNLKLGNGSIDTPALAFLSDETLGIYRKELGVLGFASSNKRLIDFSPLNLKSYKDLNFTKVFIETPDLVVLNSGQNYDSGSFSSVALTGGTGDGALCNITVISHIGTFSSPASGYNPGNYNVSLIGGTGSGAQIAFLVSELEVELTNAGSGYTDGSYSDVPLTGGSGSNATANINISLTGEVFGVSIVNSGSGYQLNDTLSFSNADVGGTGAGAVITVTSVAGEIDVAGINFSNRGTGYTVGDVLSLPQGVAGRVTNLNGEVTGVTTTLSSGSTSITVSSTVGIVQGMTVSLEAGSVGQLGQGSTTVQSVDSATQITLSLLPSVDGAATLTFTSVDALNQIILSDISGISNGDLVSQTAGTGVLGTGITVLNIDSNTNTITLSANPQTAGTATLSFAPSFGVGSPALQYTVDSVGAVENLNVVNGGSGYSVDDLLSVSPLDLVSDIVYTVSTVNVAVATLNPGFAFASSGLAVGDTVEDTSASQPTAQEVKKINLDQSGNIVSIEVESGNYSTSSTLVKTGTSSPVFTISAVENKNKYVIDDGTNLVYNSDLTLYGGSKYKFNYPLGHPFALSLSPDGTHFSTQKTATLSTTTKVVTLNNVDNIVVGMTISTVQGSIGSLPSSVVVESVDANTNEITLSANPISDGAATLQFFGVEYTDGVERNSNSGFITFKAPSSVSLSLYYYCTIHPDMAGEDGYEASITIDPNNPKVFGSGLSIQVNSVTSTDTIKSEVIDGKITSVSLVTSNITSDDIVNSASIQTSSLDSQTVNVSTISSSGSLTVSPATTFNANVNFSTTASINVSNGNFTTSGIIKTTGQLNVNDRIKITNDTISSTANTDVVISPFSGRLAKISTDSALVIPSGPATSRPVTLAQDGAIRFNTTTNQYEGYSSTNGSWSSLGGVRDIDGNTYILAELTAGANDNTLWFYNDNNNTLRLTTGFLDFRSVKKISSGRLGLPSYSVWTASTPVSLGQYIKYRNNLYEVTSAGTTGTTGNEPVHTTGSANSGSAQLTWYSSAVSPLEFSEVEELRVGPNRDCPLVINSEIKISNNVISTLIDDLVLSPNAGKKVSINAPSSLVIPVGNSNQRGSASQGSIRFNTTISQFEGYSGTNWSSLGGVRDVDGNTYIIPETAPAANENILYFYNNNVNTVQLKESALDFTNIDTITTSGGNSLAINTDIVTLNNSDTSIDNTDASSTFISTTKQYLDLGLSAGLVVDPVLRLDDQGDVYLNTGFGTGSFNGVKIFDGDLKDFELADYALKTNIISLEKGVTNIGAAVLYSTANAKGCKVTVISKSSSGKKSMSEYSVIDNGTDIFHNEIGSLNTSADGYTSSFDITPGNEVRITITLSDDHANNDTVELTVLTQVIK